jgi:hypothetical protein
VPIEEEKRRHRGKTITWRGGTGLSYAAISQVNPGDLRRWQRIE